MSRPRRARATVVTIAVLVALAVGGWTALSAWTAPTPAERYETAVLVRQDIEDTVVAAGTLRPRASVEVGAQVSGVLKRLHVAVGDHVDRGDLLAEIEAEVQAAMVESLRADLARLHAGLEEQQAALRHAEKHHDRVARLSRDNVAAQASLDASLRDRDMLRARIAAIRAEIRQAEARLRAEETTLRQSRILAPMTGTVVAIDIKEGQTLNANYEAPVILRLSDLTAMTVWTEVSEADVVRLRPGMPVWFTTLGAPEQRRPAVLRQILPVPPDAPDKETATTTGGGASVVLYTALFDVANADGGLRAGMTAEVHFVLARAEQALAVPVAALDAAASETGTGASDPATQTQVRRLTPSGTLETHAFTPGIRTRFLIEAVEGLSEGDRLVVGEKPSSGPSLIRFEP